MAENEIEAKNIAEKKSLTLGVLLGTLIVSPYKYVPINTKTVRVHMKEAK